MKALVAKIDLLPIIGAHIKTLRDDSDESKKVFGQDIISFFVAPLLLGSAVAYFKLPSEALISVLITSLSVFAALLFNLLMLVLGVIEKKKSSDKNFQELQRETYANIAYAILVSLLGVVFLIVPFFYNGTEITVYHRVFWAFVYSILFNFLLTMAMILKRMHRILVKFTFDEE